MNAGAASAAPWPPDFGRIARECETRLVEALALEPVALPGELARMEGTWQHAPAVSEARAYRGHGFAFARIATIAGRGSPSGTCW
jgi:hypothetical protein